MVYIGLVKFGVKSASVFMTRPVLCCIHLQAFSADSTKIHAVCVVHVAGFCSRMLGILHTAWQGRGEEMWRTGRRPRHPKSEIKKLHFIKML